MGKKKRKKRKEKKAKQKSKQHNLLSQLLQHAEYHTLRNTQFLGLGEGAPEILFLSGKFFIKKKNLSQKPLRGIIFSGKIPSPDILVHHWQTIRDCCADVQ